MTDESELTGRTQASPVTWASLLSGARRILPTPLYPSFEADELLSRASGLPRAFFISRMREEAGAEVAGAFARLVERRAAGEPLQYLLGEWEFLGRTFAVDPRALIPRGETEGIVEVAREAAPASRFILDAGTGSGILAVTLALERPAAHLVALDRSVAALALTRANCRRFDVSDRVLVLASDWTSALGRREDGAAPFDLVVSNPPYVPIGDAPHLEKTVSDHEPSIALYGGEDGLEPLRLLLRFLPPLLRVGAPFIFELGYGQASGVSDLVAASPSFRLASIRLDPAGIPRTATAIRIAESG